MTEKHVFTELVKGKRDAPGMLAYGLYKIKKQSEAVAQEAQGTKPPKIKQLMKDYHNRIANNPDEIADYIEAGQLLFDDLIENAQQEANKTLQPQINAGINDWVTKAHRVSMPPKPPWYEIAWLELGKILLKQIALFFLAAVGLYILILIAPQEYKQLLINKIVVEPLTKDQLEKITE